MLKKPSPFVFERLILLFLIRRLLLRLVEDAAIHLWGLSSPLVVVAK